ncbi:hypothetical protein CEXT_258071 [Caerostris extrusa]|uniref:Uncharacterized protein n=1 Tax=Caerostris extrusa TaxID=172846 RepID=A0AAV4NL01_CAEEX|nr:hypothetical protein CEXT_258071 [Caerostris extrusa]
MGKDSRSATSSSVIVAFTNKQMGSAGKRQQRPTRHDSRASVCCVPGGRVLPPCLWRAIAVRVSKTITWGGIELYEGKQFHNTIARKLNYITHIHFQLKHPPYKGTDGKDRDPGQRHSSVIVAFTTNKWDLQETSATPYQNDSRASVCCVPWWGKYYLPFETSATPNQNDSRASVCCVPGGKVLPPVCGSKGCAVGSLLSWYKNVASKDDRNVSSAENGHDKSAVRRVFCRARYDVQED